MILWNVVVYFGANIYVDGYFIEEVEHKYH
jgi:hypothetical protein